MIRSLGIVGLTVFAAQAQYADLVTNADGSVVYFSTQLRRSGTNDPLQGRIYTHGTTGLQLHAQRTRIEIDGQPRLTNYYSLAQPEISSDGRIVAYSAQRQCLGGRECVSLRLTETTVTGVPGRDQFTVYGPARLSANGRYLLRTPTSELGRDSGGLIDLTTGQESPIGLGSQSFSYPGRVVSNDGTVVSGTGISVAVAHRRQPEVQYSIHELVEDVVIEPNGKRVLFSSRWIYPESAFKRIRVIDLPTGSIRTLVEGFGDYWQPVTSDDGGRVLYLTTSQPDGSIGPPQARIIGIDGSGDRTVTLAAEGMSIAILSGDGRVVYGLTLAGRLIRVDVESGSETELLPRTVSLGPTGFVDCESSGPLVAGSLRRVTGAGYDGERVRVLFDGVEAPIASLKPGELWFQTPWESAGRSARFSIEVDAPDGPFEQPRNEGAGLVAESSPCILHAPDELGTLTAYGQRWSLAFDAGLRLLSPTNPAREGSIVNLYALGLGPVIPKPRTGDPAPADGSLVRTEASFACHTYAGAGAQYDVPVLFAGLAPGLTGVYQMQLRLPSRVPDDRTYSTAMQVTCREAREGSTQFSGLLPFAPQP